jgi:DNA-binding transcriptional LysR family regulator
MSEVSNSETGHPKTDSLRIEDIDWEDVRVFLAAVRSGGFAKAAADLSIGQATISRRIERMEKNLGVRLFDRTAGGSKPSSEATRIIDLLRSAEDSINRAVERIGSSGRRLAGEVRILVTEGLATYWLAPFIAGFRRSNPDVSVRVITESNVAFDRGEGYDIQLQFFEPFDQSRIAARMGTLQFIPMAARSYIAANGAPRTMKELEGHQLFDHTAYLLDKGSWATWLDDRSDITVATLVSNSTPMLAELVRQGHGIALLPNYAPLVDDRLVPLPLGVEFVSPFWMSYRRENADQPHVRALVEVMKTAIDRRAMPWFGDNFIFPTPDLLESWREIMHARLRQSASGRSVPGLAL